MRIGKKIFLPKFLKEMKKLRIGGITGGNSAKLIVNGDDCFDEFISAIRNAKKNINLETYIFKSDTLGWKIAEELSAAARRGVDVNIIYDAVGSIRTSPAVFDQMRSAGAHVIQHNPLIPWRFFWNISFRDHRKILVIDGKTAFAGGINIGLEYAGKKYRGDAWRDTHLKIEGPAAREVQFFFIENWIRNGGYISDYSSYFPQPRESGKVPIMILSTKSRKKIAPIMESYLSSIRHAKKNIYITNAYFIPDRKIYIELMKAAERGIDVSIILPWKSDLPFVKLASQFLYRRYLKHGIKIFEYRKSILHAKTAVIDGVVSTIGSSNIDRLSFNWNLELNAMIIDQPFGKKMEKLFHDDKKDCVEVTLAMIERRSVAQYLLEWFCYRFRNLF